MTGVAFESRVFDPIGHAWVDALPGSELSAAVRRVTRTATLDGRAALIDMGYTASDATFKVIARPDPFNEAQLLRLVRVYPEVCWRRPKIDPVCRLKNDPGTKAVFEPNSHG